MSLSDWYMSNIHQGLLDFIIPLIPWIAFSFIMVLADWRFSYQLWKMSKTKYTKPMPQKYVNKILNCVLLVFMAGCIMVSSGMSTTVNIIATTGLIAWAAIEFTRCINKYMEIEGIDKQFNIFKLFKKADMEDILEDKTKEDNNTDNTSESK